MRSKKTLIRRVVFSSQVQVRFQKRVETGIVRNISVMIGGFGYQLISVEIIQKIINKAYGKRAANMVTISCPTGLRRTLTVIDKHGRHLLGVCP